MGSLFRSEPMSMCQLFLQSEAAYQCVSELGELGLVQFLDLNSDVNAFKRRFVNDVKRCDEMERQLRFLEKEINLEGIPMTPEDPFVETPLPKDMIDMEAKLEKTEEEIKQINENVSQMNINYTRLQELKQVLRQVDVFFATRRDIEGAVEPANMDSSTQLPMKSELALEASTESRKLGDNLNFIAGVISNSRFENFERMLWRVGRGIIFCHRLLMDEPMQDVTGGNAEWKSVFIIFFPGEQFKSRVRKICEAFKANIYPCPASTEGRREASIEVLTRLEDMNQVFGGSRDHRCRVLTQAAKDVRTSIVQVFKMKAVFHVMNMLNIDVTQKCFIAECWCPEHDMLKIQAALRRGTEAAGSSFPCIINKIDTTSAPPTYNKTNRFTSGFQNIVDAYGVATYREMNPTPYAIITFPFLFAVMFGDAGHGLLMVLAALALIAYEKPLSKIRDEITATFFGGRYIMLLMGIFSIYTGVIYNDFFSKSMNIFGTSWIFPPIEQSEGDTAETVISLDAEENFKNSSYAFGVDPVWMIASNKIQFTNSYKMKMAIVLGLMQMIFGTCLSVWNFVHFKDQTGFPPPRTALERTLRRTLNIWSCFIPEIIFLTSLFGYLVFLIVYKWLLPLGAPNGEGSGCSRSILILFINMFMMQSPKEPCYQTALFKGQSTVNMIVMGMALLSVPWLLLAKPLYLNYLNGLHSSPLPLDFVPIITEEEEMAADEDRASSTSSSRRKSAVSLHTLKDSKSHDSAILHEENDDIESHHHEFEFDFGDIFIHQIIHTIEYCLGAISNTASYLRLWALSLAHSQLSEVLWNMLFKAGIFANPSTKFSMSMVLGPPMLLFSFAAWAFLTVAILLVMEGLSAFLHALRLHWVEFMNKFFKGEGYLFTPFNFLDVIRSIDEK